MRLIDADETIKQYTQIFVEKYGVECGEMFQGVLKQMPTAYNVDKVVEQLEWEKDFAYADFDRYAEEKGLDKEQDFFSEGMKRAIEVLKRVDENKDKGR